MPTPKQSTQRPIPITQDEGYDFNMDEVIRQQNKNPTQIEYNQKIIMDKLVYHKQPYIHTLSTPLLMTQQISYQGN